MKIKIFFKKRFYLYFSPIEAYTTVLRGIASDEFTKENNSLTLVVWKCLYDRIVYIVKKYINIFSKKEVLRGAQKLPPPIHKIQNKNM